MYDSINNIKYAGFWNRALAYLIDHIILSFIKVILFIPFSTVLSYDSIFNINEKREYFASINMIQEYDDPALMFFAVFMMFILFLILNAIAGWMYYSLFETSYKMATPGKMLIGIKVTDVFGQKLSFGKATGRYFAKYISAMILFIGYLMAAFTEKKQALHDILANCVVVYDLKFQKIEIVDQSENELKTPWDDYVI